MRSTFGFKVLLGMVALLSIGAASCTSEPAGVFADILWEVRCQDMGMCSSYPQRSIYGFNGETSQTVSCSVINSGDNRILTFSGQYNGAADRYGISLRNATFARSGGTPSGAGCEVQVNEGGVTYTGVCGSADPSDTQPCRVSGVAFGADAAGRPQISGQIYCRGISPTATPGIDREVTAPGPGMGSTPLTFTIYDCNGFNPD